MVVPSLPPPPFLEKLQEFCFSQTWFKSCVSQEVNSIYETEFSSLILQAIISYSVFLYNLHLLWYTYCSDPKNFQTFPPHTFYIQISLLLLLLIFVKFFFGVHFTLYNCIWTIFIVFIYFNIMLTYEGKIQFIILFSRKAMFFWFLVTLGSCVGFEILWAFLKSFFCEGFVVNSWLY